VAPVQKSLDLDAPRPRYPASYSVMVDAKPKNLPAPPDISIGGGSISNDIYDKIRIVQP
jgi:hypothetical protein